MKNEIVKRSAYPRTGKMTLAVVVMVMVMIVVFTWFIIRHKYIGNIYT